MKYETALKNSKFVVVIYNSAEESAHAREIVNRTNPEHSAEHPPENADTNVGRWEHSLLP